MNLYIYIYICVCVWMDGTKYMFRSSYQNVGKNHNLVLTNRSFENVVQFRHVGKTVTNKNDIHE